MRYARLLPALLAGGLMGCVTDDISLSVNGFAAVTPTTECVADPMTLAFQSRGTLDVGIVEAAQTSGFLIAPVLQNNIIVRTTTMTTTDMDSITVLGFDVELIPDPRDPAVDAALPIEQRRFFYPVGGVRIPPGGMRGALFVETISYPLATLIARAIPEGRRPASPSIVARIRPVGQRAGLRLNGAIIDFPIDICKFCLTSIDPCPAGGFDKAAVSNGGCFLQQDAVTTCCVQGSSLLCGGAVPTKMTM